MTALLHIAARSAWNRRGTLALAAGTVVEISAAEGDFTMPEGGLLWFACREVPARSPDLPKTHAE